MVYGDIYLVSRVSDKQTRVVPSYQRQWADQKAAYDSSVIVPLLLSRRGQKLAKDKREKTNSTIYFSDRKLLCRF